MSPSAVLGGAATVALLWMKLFASLREAKLA